MMDDPTLKEFLLQRYRERIEKLSSQDQLGKFCTDAGFLTDENSHNSQIQWPVAKIGPVLEVATCCLQGKYGVDIRIKSVNKDNSHSWVRISHGLNKLVTDFSNNEQETSEMQFEEYALKLTAGDFASRSKAKAKPQKRDSVRSSTRITLIGERTWTDVEENIRSPIIQCRRNSSIFFVMEVYLETMMERLNSVE